MYYILPYNYLHCTLGYRKHCIHNVHTDQRRIHNIIIHTLDEDDIILEMYTSRLRGIIFIWQVVKKMHNM